MQFGDLQKQYEILKTDIDARAQPVCSSAHYIFEPEVYGSNTGRNRHK